MNANGEGIRCAATSRGAISALATSATRMVERTASFKKVGSYGIAKGLTPLDGPGRFLGVP
jgi:hypothetical protein